MCGIATIFSYRDGPPVLESELLTIRDHMTARGPDGAGVWISEDRRIGLAHRRLAILDLSPSGAQPMFDATGTFGISFNGEIYNYRELRTQLEAKGFRFKSGTDTEVLLHLYADRGTKMLDALRGMYAFALWDGRKQALFLARDPYGIKPLYYADDGKTLRAASQVKALLAGESIDTSVSAAGHVGFFLWGHVPDPHTLYRGIRALSAGHSLWIERGQAARESSFCSISEIFSSPAPDNGHHSFREPMRDALRDAVRHHLIADVPVGVFLSSGVDSTVVAALAAEEGGRLQTVTLAFEGHEGTPNDETPLAEEVARLYGTDHRTVRVTRRDFEDRLDHMFWSMDQPTIDGVNSYWVSRVAQQADLKVALSGLGGDELFGGYPSFHQIPRSVKTLSPLNSIKQLGRGFRIISAPLLKHWTSPKYAGIFEYGGTYAGAYLLRRGLFMPWELPEVLDADLVREGWAQLRTIATIDHDISETRSIRSKVACLESCWYMRNQLLRDSDWAGMAHSLEIRVPLVDIELLRSTVRWLGNGRAPDKRTLLDAPLWPLPDAIVSRPKIGFTVPVREWLSANTDRGLRSWAKLVYSEFTKRPSGISGSGATVPTPLHVSSVRGVTHSARLATPPSRKADLLVLLTDGFGGRGGIAKFNRDLLTALCLYPGIGSVTALPRVIYEDPRPFPSNLIYETQAAAGKQAYAYHLGKLLLQRKDFAGVICGHIHLLPLAVLAARRSQVPLIMTAHGIEVWQRPQATGLDRSFRSLDTFVSVSELTKQRFLEWAPLRSEQGKVIPNCVDLGLYGPGPKPPHLLERYGIPGRRVIMTLCRLDARQRLKGIDEVMEVLPTLLHEMPDLIYLIVGDGSDGARLKAKADSLGLHDHVVFTGYVAEEDKAEHYRLADAFVMVGRGEGFGIVYLEAMACGIPVVASKADASREAVLEGRMGLLADPSKPAEIAWAIKEALCRPHVVPNELQYFSFDHFVARWHGLLREILEPAGFSPVRHPLASGEAPLRGATVGQGVKSGSA